MSPIEEYAARYGAAYRWIATATVMLTCVGTTAASTMVNVALPDIMGAFGLGDDQVQWLSTGFLAAMTASMLLTAWTLGSFGYRNAFLGAQTLFIASSLLGAAADSGGVIILARVLQGTACGLAQPLAMVVLSQVFPPEKRGTAMGIFGLGVVLSPALGPSLGGYLVDEYSWRDVFLAIVPLTMIAMVACAVFLPGRDRRAGARRPSFDVVGMVSLAVLLVCLLTALSNGQRYGWDSFFVVGMFAGALLSAGVFLVWESVAKEPLFQLRLFAYRQFSLCCVVAFALGVGIFGSTYIIPMFVQFVQNYTPTRAGLLLMPAGLVLGMTTPLAGRLGDRAPPRLPITIGLAIFGYSCWLCADADVDTPFWSFALWIAFGRVGLGLINPSLNAGALRALPQTLLAQGSGTINFARQLGGALGVNVLSVIVDRRTTFHGEALAQAMTPATAAASAAVQQLAVLLTHWGNPFGWRLPTGAPPAAMAYLESMLVPKARLFAYRDGFLAVTVAFAFACLAATLIRGRKPAAVRT
jgi:EmrB/QacA subfamily drug resistance transporter